MMTPAQARSEAIAACFDILTAYLTDHCPEGENWEDFDGAVDELRTALDEAGSDARSIDA